MQRQDLGWSWTTVRTVNLPGTRHTAAGVQYYNVRKGVTNGHEGDDYSSISGQLFLETLLIESHFSVSKRVLLYESLTFHGRQNWYFKMSEH